MDATRKISASDLQVTACDVQDLSYKNIRNQFFSILQSTFSIRITESDYDKNEVERVYSNCKVFVRHSTCGRMAIEGKNGQPDFDFITDFLVVLHRLISVAHNPQDRPHLDEEFDDTLLNVMCMLPRLNMLDKRDWHTKNYGKELCDILMPVSKVPKQMIKNHQGIQESRKHEYIIYKEALKAVIQNIKILNDQLISGIYHESTCQLSRLPPELFGVVLTYNV